MPVRRRPAPVAVVARAEPARVVLGQGPMIAVRNLHKTFGRHRVLDDVSFTVAPGEIVALVGENGAGKSTLVACLAGLLSPDAGQVTVAGRTAAITNPGVGVVWQNLALCDNLDVVANLFLGRERARRRAAVLDELSMQREAAGHFAGLGIELPDLRRPAGQLSGGQRQLVAIARALLSRPGLLVLDEPTAALGVHESAAVEALLRRLRADGVTILLISHRMEQVFSVADRVLVLRNGRVQADVSTVEVHPDDVVAMIAGVATESAARRQLQRLHSLVDQLAAVDPSASIPLILSSLSASLGAPRISLHLLDAGAADGAAVLHCHAAVGLHPALRGHLQRIAVRADGELAARVALGGGPVVLEDTRAEPALAAAGVAAAWAVPIIGSEGLAGVLTIYADAPGVPSAEQLELAVLHAHLAAATIERERLFDAVSARNRNLESLRAMLDSLAGPGPVRDGLGIALLPLCRALGATAVGLLDGVGVPTVRAAITADAGEPAAAEREHLADVARQVLDGPPALLRARLVGHDAVAVPVVVDERRAVLAAWWAAPAAIGNETLDLLDDAARSLALAIEREAVEQAQQESATLRRSNRLQREFLHRLSHELRTPLTAIHGYADTLRQPDVAWDEDSQQRFLASIATESARMRRLVADLLDTSAMEGGGLRLNPDWCDVALLVETAVACVPGAAEAVRVHGADGVPPLWADHDRIEQVLVNLLDNALRHGRPPVDVEVATEPGADPAAAGWLLLTVGDAGAGVPAELADTAFEPMVRGAPSGGAGLGLTIVRGIVEGHGGSVGLIDRSTVPAGPVPGGPVPDRTVPSSMGGAAVRVRLPLEPA